MKTPEVGDIFKIATRKMYASGKVIKVNPTTFVYESFYAPSPTIKPIRQEIKLKNSDYAEAQVVRGGAKLD